MVGQSTAGALRCPAGEVHHKHVKPYAGKQDREVSLAAADCRAERGQSRPRDLGSIAGYREQLAGQTVIGDSQLSLARSAATLY